MSTHNIQFHEKKIPEILILFSGGIGIQKQVQISQGKRAIGVWPIEVKLYRQVSHMKCQCFFHEK